jgi:hypothetical protein
MIELKQLLQLAAVKRTLIVDDAYDDTPIAADLIIDQDNWRQFFEDKNAEDEEQIRRIYNRYDQVRADDLQMQDDFVAALWRNRGGFRPELIGPLFRRYQEDKATDLAYLQTLVGRLQALGLECDTAGRSFAAKVVNTDLIVIDLYLGSAQNDQAVETSVRELQLALAARKPRPPLVVLMSRSSRLSEKRSDFRDRTGLFESAFRFIRKAELGEEGCLNRLLARLAGHYPESLKLARFLDAWQVGVGQASDRTAKLIRLLDIGDHAQIQQLLLNEEGAPLGSYLVDVFDQVLQHEVERDGTIIDAAIALNQFKGDDYPPPYVAGSPDLQHLVFRSVFQNSERLRLSSSVDSRVGFGDLLRRKPAATAPAEPAPPALNRLADVGPAGVMAVLTPACDLQRQGAKSILLLTGELMALQPATWAYTDTPIRTSIIEFPTGERFWIKWNLKHIETISHAELATLLDSPTGFSVVARLRDAYALELQQRLLSSLGRIGLTSPMPATFSVNVEVYLPGTNKKLFRLEGPGLDAIAGVCYVGRTGPKDMRLVLCEDDCEAICRALLVVDPQRVHPDARALAHQLNSTGELQHILEKGLVLPSPEATGAKEITVEISNSGGAPTTKKVLGFVICGEGQVGRELSPGEIKKTGIYLAVK